MTNQNILKEATGLTTPLICYEEAVSSNKIKANTIHIIGFEFDGTACFRKGAKDGPNAIRDVSYGIESYSPYLKSDLSEIPTFTDLGNLPVDLSADQKDSWSIANDSFDRNFSEINFKNNNVKLLTLGGEHSISYPPIKKYLEDFDDLVLIHLDAHADLRDGYEGYHFSHASIIRRSLDLFGKNNQLIQYGIRSGTKEEYKWMKANNTLCESQESFIKRIKDIDNSRPIYLTLDLDYFDPSFFPGTGTPEPGGEDFHSFVRLLKILKNKNLVGADAVELSPSIDKTGNSSVFAAKVVRELILVMS